MKLLSTLVTLFALCTVIGCGGKPVADKPAGGDHGHEHGGDEHGHGEIGPHKGEIIELGKGDYHAELVHDDAAQTVTVYLLDGKAEKNAAVEAKEIGISLMVDGTPTQFSLLATPDTGDPEGKASKFMLKDESLTTALDKPSSKARLNITIDGKPYSGEIEQHVH